MTTEEAQLASARSLRISSWEYFRNSLFIRIPEQDPVSLPQNSLSETGRNALSLGYSLLFLTDPNIFKSKPALLSVLALL